MNRNVESIIQWYYQENPTFVLMLGMCPTLAKLHLLRSTDLEWDFQQLWFTNVFKPVDFRIS